MKHVKRAKELKPLSLSPLTTEEAIRAAIATGPITDPELRSSRKKKSAIKDRESKPTRQAR
jgi:hypothetical protein